MSAGTNRLLRALNASSSSRPLRDLSWPATCAVIFAVTLLACWPALRASFVWNDLDYVTKPELRSLRGLWQIWFEVGSTEQHYPLLHSFFWLEHRLWGDAPLGYHLTNVLLHAANACLFTFCLRRLAVRSALLAGLVFALHPVCVESVAWISEQKNTLSTLFFLAAALAYLRFDATRRSASVVALRVSAGTDAPPPSTPPAPPSALRFYRLATLLFILALLTKSLTAVLPPALLVLAWWRHGRLNLRRDLVPLLPWFLLGALAGLFSAWVEHTYVGASGAEFDLTPLQRLLVAGRATWFYLGHTFLPLDLVFIYPRWHVDPAAAWQWLFPATALALTATLFALRHRTRPPLAAWLLFIGLLFPVSGFFSLYAFRYSFVADHWQYLPALPVIAFAVSGAASLLSRAPAFLARLAPAAATLLLLAFAALSWRQTLAYHDIVTFYRTIIRDNPACWMAHSNLGDVYFRASINPDGVPRALDASGITDPLRAELLAQNLLASAIAQYRETLRLKPDHVEGHNSLASACLQAGLIDESLTHFQRALELRPDYPDALNNLGFLLTQLGRPADALEPLRHALRLNPRYAEAHDHLGLALLALGRPDQAIRSYREALRFAPALTAARNNLGNALAQTGQLDAAIAEYRHVLREKPADAEVRLNLGNALAAAARLPDAIAEYETVLRQRPNMPEAHNNLGFALLRLGRSAEAAARFRRALELRPDYREAAANLHLAEQTSMP